MKVDEFTIERLEEIPIKEWDEEDKDRYTSIIIVPMNEMHDSGFRCMTFLFCKGTEIVCRSHGYSDVLHIDDIGGYGDWMSSELSELPEKIVPKGWRIDCLPNGYLRLFGPKIKNNPCGSSDYEIYGVRSKE